MREFLRSVHSRLWKFWYVLILYLSGPARLSSTMLSEAIRLFKKPKSFIGIKIKMQCLTAVKMSGCVFFFSFQKLECVDQTGRLILPLQSEVL